MGNGGVNGTNVSSTVLSPNFTLFTGTPTYVANMRVRSNAPSNLAENETKIEILKRQQICLSQVFSYLVCICQLNNLEQKCVGAQTKNHLHYEYIFRSILKCIQKSQRKQTTLPIFVLLSLPLQIFCKSPIHSDTLLQFTRYVV